MSQSQPSDAQIGIVDARRKWNSVAHLRGGVEYKIEVAPGQLWYDWRIRCGPEGYELWYLIPFRWMRRLRAAPWFALVGAIGEGPLFEITDSQIVSSQENGQLRCFANDIRFMYWNNRGTIEVRVTPLRTI